MKRKVKITLEFDDKVVEEEDFDRSLLGWAKRLSQEANGLHPECLIVSAEINET